MKLYTKQGDTGKTSLFGGRKVSKADVRVEAYGTVDELNAVLGITLSHLQTDDKLLREELLTIQSVLFEIGSDLASEKDMNRLTEDDVAQLEGLIDAATVETPPLQAFILPGGSTVSSYLHLARTVCRRAERHIVQVDNVNPFILKYMNRLSDLFFAWSRWYNHMNEHPEIIWKSRS